MSLASACLWTLARTLVICLVAWPVCAAVERWLRGLAEERRSVALIGLLAPFCFPELLVGYAFRDLAMFHPQWAELLCSGLLFVRVVPVGAVALLMAPPPECDAAAIHCQRMFLARVSHPSQQFDMWRCYWHGPIKRALPALGLMAVVAFQEFELAALLMTTSWTDWFVAAERVGLARSEMLRQAAWPLVMQLPVLIGVVSWLGHVGWTPRPSESRAEGRTDGTSILRGRGRIVPRWALAYVLMALVVGCVAPLSLLGWRTIEGLSWLARQRTQQMGLLREMVISMAVSACAGLTAWTVCRRVMTMTQLAPAGLARRGRVGLGWVLVTGLLPGLLGSLLLSLGAVTLFQVSWLRPLYDTPLPWVLALTVWLLPRAAVLQLWLDAVRPSEAVHLAEMLGGSGMSRSERQKTPHPSPLPAKPGRGDKAKEKGKTKNEAGTMTPFTSTLCPSTFNPQRSTLLWRLRDQPQFLAMSLLCYWAYCDLPTAYLLAPTGMAPGLVRLYNFMHFGRSAALSAEACLFFGGPIVVVAGAILVGRVWRR